MKEKKILPTVEKSVEVILFYNQMMVATLVMTWMYYFLNIKKVNVISGKRGAFLQFSLVDLFLIAKLPNWEIKITLQLNSCWETICFMLPFCGMAPVYLGLV